MSTLLSIILFIHFHFLLTMTKSTQTLEPACKTRCGPLEVKYPFGTGHGCGSPRFHPYVACSPDATELLLTTHTGSYPITSISYTYSTLTISPSCMSNCTSMQPDPPKFGLDWAGPFQLGSSTFILLACSSSTIKGNPICDPSSAYLCPSIYSCPGVVSLGLPLFPPTNSCCVYSPANLDPHDELDIRELKCAGYTSVVALGDLPTNPGQWLYGVELKYTLGGLDSYNITPSCRACEMSGGVCGYAPPSNYFVCVCTNGNTTTDCYSYSWIITTSSSLQLSREFQLGFLAIFVFFIVI